MTNQPKYSRAREPMRADQVRPARLAAGLSQLDLAYEAGVGTATIHRIESGTCEPLRSTLCMLAAALDAHREEVDALTT